MRIATLLMSVVAASMMVQAQNSPRAAVPTRGGSAENGKKLYEHVGCWECHGHEGQGGAAGKRIAPKPIALEDFRDYCRRPTGEMPPYTAKILSDAELADIHAYLQSLPPPPSAKSIAILNLPVKSGSGASPEKKKSGQ